MLIGNTSQYYKKLTSSNAKMEEYDIDNNDRIAIDKPIEKVFLTAIGIIGEVSANIQRNENEIDQILNTNRDELLFSAKFIEDYNNGNINVKNKNLYLIISAVAYYLANNIGNSKVLVSKINLDELDLNLNGLDYAIVKLLKDEFDTSDEEKYQGKYFSYLINMKDNLENFFKEYYVLNCDEKKKFRAKVYNEGTDEELLFVDILLTIYDLKIRNSFIKLSNEYINIENDEFKRKLIENNKIKELWPSQKNIGEKGVFKGKSAVIQLPTGSGKTKSLTILLSTYFLQTSKRIAVIVAPFRALCREISNDLMKDFGNNDRIKVNEMNDILNEENLFTFENNLKTVIILTPEKLTYILKKQKDIINEIGLIVFDEGHIFDEWKRGINYELLISNLKLLLNEDTQKVLISAVGSNLNTINKWLNGEEGVTIKNNLITSTEKSICFVNWQNFESDLYGYLNFLNPLNMELEFYVPRVIKRTLLNKKPRERKDKYFPSVNLQNFKGEDNDIAIYLGIRLCIKGSTIVFCGTKTTASKILKRILDLSERSYDISNFKKSSKTNEIEKLCHIISKNYGEENEYFNGAKQGIFIHHADISNGIKISLEYAMKHKLISFLICTSTLAQGVNLPIKYLIMTSIYQAGNLIKSRDFNNLIGRAGRPGMYTEGTVIFSDPYVYTFKDYRYYNKYIHRWNQYKNLIMNTEQESDNMSMFMEMDDNVTLDIINSYYNGDIETALTEYLLTFEKSQREKEKNRINNIISLLSPIENFIMSYLTKEDLEDNKENIAKIATETLGYYLSKDEKKENIIKLFMIIAKFCLEKVPMSEKRYLYSENVFGVKDNEIIENYINENLEKIINSKETEELFDNLYNLIEILKKYSEEIRDISKLWINGHSYKVIMKNTNRNLEINECLKMCNNIISYEIPLIASAVQDNLKSKIDNNNYIFDIFDLLIKQLKYGLKSEVAIKIYELGFSDREVAKELEYYLDNNIPIKPNIYNVKDLLLEIKEEILEILDKYPSVFKYQLDLLENK